MYNELRREGQFGSAVLGRVAVCVCGAGALGAAPLVLCERGRMGEVRISKAPLTLWKSVGEPIMGRGVGCVVVRVLLRLLWLRIEGRRGGL